MDSSSTCPIAGSTGQRQDITFLRTKNYVMYIEMLNLRRFHYMKIEIIFDKRVELKGEKNAYRRCDSSIVKREN